MARARGANAVMAFALETVYGSPPGSGYNKLPFVSSQLGEEQGLITSDLLGQGRDPADPALDVINNVGDVVVPVDLRNIGFWLKLFFGAPTSTQGTAAKGSFVFSALPADMATITVGSSDWTFVASGATGDESVIGATLAATLATAVQALNQSATADFAACSFSLSLDGTTINILYKTIGTGGNSVTLAASTSPASHATASGADLAGGATSGPYNHVFASGGAVLPSASVEVGFSDVPNYAMNFGVMVDKIAIQLQRSGLLNATLSCIAQGESPNTDSTASGSPAVLAVERFTQFTGKVTRLGVQLGDLVSGNFNLMNNLDKVEVIREDGRIAGADPGEAAYTAQAVLRFKDRVLRDQAANGLPIDLTFAWKIADGKSLTVVLHRFFLPKPKLPVTGPGGIQATYDGQGAKDTTLGRAVTVTLVNDKVSY